MRNIKIDGVDAKVMRELNDDKYGKVLRVYLKDRKTYVVNGKIVDDRDIIDELDTKYGIAPSKRKFI